MNTRHSNKVLRKAVVFGAALMMVCASSVAVPTQAHADKATWALGLAGAALVGLLAHASQPMPVQQQPIPVAAPMPAPMPAMAAPMPAPIMAAPQPMIYGGGGMVPMPAAAPAPAPMGMMPAQATMGPQGGGMAVRQASFDPAMMGGGGMYNPY